MLRVLSFALCLGALGAVLARPVAASATDAHRSAGPRALELQPGAPPLRIDGRLDEAAWQQAPVYESFNQNQPVNGPVPAGLRTTVQVLVDGQALVFGIRAYDTQPELMRGGLTRRDQVKRDQDFVVVWLDPVGRRRAAQFVRVGLDGSLSDGLHRADDDEEDFGPDFPVEAAVQRLPDGYSVELRWPLSSLRYSYEGGLPWRVMVGRSVPHAGGALLLSAPLTSDALNFIAEMQVLEGVEAVAQRVRDQGFVSLRTEWTLRSTQAQRALGTERSSQGSLGAELKWRPRADWVVDALLNPDFAQLELDEPPATGATRLARELPEKRAYFLESADVLGLPLPAFYSRAVVDPRWGLRATWRGAQADATALQLEDRAGGSILRGSPYATASGTLQAPSDVTLLRARWLGTPAGAGLLLSTREMGPGLYNRVAGVDGHWRYDGEGSAHQLRWALLGSQTTADVSDDGSVQRRGEERPGQMAWMEWRQRSPLWHHRAELSATSPGFAHDNGFLAQSGVAIGQWEINRRMPAGRLREAGLPVHELDLHLGLYEAQTLRDSRLSQPAADVVARRVQPGFWFAAPWRTDFWMNRGFDQQRARQGGVLHDVTAWHLGFMTAPWPWMSSLTGEATWGRQLDAEADRTGEGGNIWLLARTRWALPAGMSLESDHRWSRAWVLAPDGRPGFLQASWRWLGMLHLSPQQTLRVIAQRQVDRRYAESGLALPASSQQRDHLSLVWQQRYAAGKSWALGWVREQSPKPWSVDAGRDDEIFVKLQWELAS